MGQKKLLMPGILVEKTFYKESGYILFNFEFAVSSPANPMFFTSPALRKAINANRFFPGKPVGYIDFHKNPVVNPADPHRFTARTYPFYNVGKALFEHRGISKGLERICNRELVKVFGRQIIIEPSIVAEAVRVGVLTRRGVRNMHAHYSVPIGQMQEAINRSTRKFRRSHRPQAPVDRLEFALSEGSKLREKKRRRPL